MSEIKDLESYTLELYSFLLREFGLKKPRIKRDSGITTIYYLSKLIAIEIELDWREADIFVLVTKLENENLPGGYYMWKGKRYRLYIEDVLKILSIEGTNKLVESIITNRKKGGRTKKAMEERIAAYKQLLLISIDRIINEGVSVFEKYVDPIDRL
ncbi:MAG: hypothetical protein ACFFG0_43270 [Candidatus Thorarchaeota archaeon]